MSLLEKASIITTPTAYGVGVLNSIKPAQSFGQELVTNGDFSNGYVGWNLSGNPSNYSVEVVNYDGKTNALHFTTPDNNTGINQIILQSNRQYLVKFDLKVISGNVYVGKSNNKVTGANLNPSEWTSYEEYWTANDDYFRVYSSGNAEFYVDNVSVVEVTDADFDFDRNSTGTRVNEDYLIEDVPYNLSTYSEDFSNAAWTKLNVTVTSDEILSPDGTLSADKLIATSGASNKVIFQSISAGTYTASVFAKKGEFEGLFIGTGTVGAFFNLNTYSYRTHYTSPPTSFQIESYGNGWHRYSITFTLSSNDNLYIGPNDNVSTNLAITGDGSKGIYIFGAQLVKGDQPKDYLQTTDRLNIPRLDYTNGTASILLEPQSTNLETKSNGFSTWTLVSNVTRTADYIVSPEGVSNATRLQFTSNGFVANTTITSGTQYTVSVYAKRNDTGTQSFGFFVDGSGAVNSEMSLTSEWKRFSFTHTATNGSYVGLAGLSGADVSVYGFQLEVQSYPTSYIPTSGSSVTRAAETLNNAGNSDLINSTEGVLYAEIKFASFTGGDYFGLNNGTNVQRVLIERNGTSIRGNINSIQLTSTLTSLDNKIAIKWKLNDFQMYLNGVKVSEITSGSSPTGLDRLSFEIGGALGLYFYGRCKTVAVFKEALSDTELACLTSTNNREIFLNYYYRMQYVGANTEALSCAEQTFNI